jgi:hypothetical protein
MQGLLMIECLLLLIAVGGFVHYVWSIKREIQKHHDWLRAFQAEDARQEQEFRRKLRAEE